MLESIYPWKLIEIALIYIISVIIKLLGRPSSLFLYCCLCHLSTKNQLLTFTILCKSLTSHSITFPSTNCLSSYIISHYSFFTARSLSSWGQSAWTNSHHNTCNVYYIYIYIFFFCVDNFMFTIAWLLVKITLTALV